MANPKSHVGTSPNGDLVRLDWFPIEGNLRDRSQRNTYPIITDW